VLKAYRGKGIARALIARSLGMLKALNLQEAALTVVSGNASGALRLDESMGYRTYRTTVEWRKPLA
jgi:GNAT superfamily N-acetyltransferase